MSLDLRWTLAEIGRLMLVHRLATGPVAGALGLDTLVAAALVDDGIIPGDADTVDPLAATLVLNILVRIETRCGGDGGAIRHAFVRSIDTLGGASIAEALVAGPSIEGLHLLREAAGTMPVPKVKMWRCPDQYS